MATMSAKRLLYLIFCGALLFAWVKSGTPVSAEQFRPRFGFHTQSQQAGVDQAYSDFRAFLPYGDETGIMFLDTRLLLDSEGSSAGYNLGFGVRSPDDDSGLLWGLNFFTDERQTSAATYQQIGLGTELFFDWLEFRTNFYLPVGDQRTALRTSPVGVPQSQSVVFQNNFLVSIDEFDHEALIEQSLRGFETEFGGKLFDDINQGIAINGYLGVYGYENPDLEDILGVSARLNVNAFDSVDLNLGVQSDSFFDTQGTFGLTFYSNGLRRKWRPRRNSITDRMNDPVTRRSAIVVANGNIGAGRKVVGTRLSHADGTDVRVVHVDSAAAGGGDGTFENPINAVDAVQANSTTRDIVYLYSGSVFDGQGTLALQDSQLLLGEGGGVTHLVDTLQRGTIDLPNVRGLAGAVPILRNSTGTAIQLANNSLVNNVSVVNPISGAGIAGTDISGASVYGSSFETAGNSVYGMMLSGSAEVSVARSVFTTFGGSTHGLFTQGTSRLIADNTQVSTAGFRASSVFAGEASSVVIDKGSQLATSGFFGTGVSAVDTAVVRVDHGSSISTTGPVGRGIHASDQSTVSFENASSITTQGNTSSGILSQDNASVFVRNKATIETSGDGAYGLFPTHQGSVTLDKSLVTTHGAVAYGVRSQHSGTTKISNDSKIMTTDVTSYAVHLEASSRFEAYGSQIVAVLASELFTGTQDMDSDMRLVLGQNTLDGGSGTIELRNSRTAAITVEGATDLSEFAADNGISVGQISTTSGVLFAP